MTTNNSLNKKAFTLIEVMIVVAIIGLLSTLALMAWRNQINKSQDALRKKDLQRISIAFEDYYNDNDYYPEGDILTHCGGTELSPYLGTIPCDPVYSTPYCYLAGDDLRSYRLLTTLGNLDDPNIAKLGCSGDAYCGWEEECNALVGRDTYNFGIASLNTPLANPDMPIPSSSSTPTPTSTPNPGNYACTPAGACDNYGINPSCPLTFANESSCRSYCPTSQISERCPE